MKDDDTGNDASAAVGYDGSSISHATSLRLDRDLHIRYFARCLVNKLPSGYSSLDTNRLTLVHFAVHALDMLGVLHSQAEEEKYRIDRSAIIEWIYSLQFAVQHITSSSSSSRTHEDSVVIGGFKGGTFLGPAYQQQQPFPGDIYNHIHIAMTYTALCTLIALGDDLSRVNKFAIIQSLRVLQTRNGSFTATATGTGTATNSTAGGKHDQQHNNMDGEHDMRFVYCACVISTILNDWSGLDQNSIVRYISSCRSHDGGIALLPGQEGHGGSTFCAIASLYLMGKLHQVLTERLSPSMKEEKAKDKRKTKNTSKTWKDELIYWCVHRQTTPTTTNNNTNTNNGGMQGRPNKADDTCYSYWIGGTLYLLGHGDLLNHDLLQQFILQNQKTKLGGGFSKVIGSPPDLLHSFYSLAYLSSLYYNHQQGNNNNDEENTKLSADENQVLVGEDLPLCKLDCAIGMCWHSIQSFMEGSYSQ